MNAPQTRNYRKQFELIREGRDFSRLMHLPGDFSEEFVMAMTDEKWGQWYKRMAQRRTTIYTRIKKGGKEVNQQEARKQLLQYEQSFLLAETSTCTE